MEENYIVAGEKKLTRKTARAWWGRSTLQRAVGSIKTISDRRGFPAGLWGRGGGAHPKKKSGGKRGKKGRNFMEAERENKATFLEYRNFLTWLTDISQTKGHRPQIKKGAEERERLPGEWNQGERKDKRERRPKQKKGGEPGCDPPETRQRKTQLGHASPLLTTTREKGKRAEKPKTRGERERKAEKWDREGFRKIRKMELYERA